ncbi:unnamed protein product [Haemonchus placei]|uniref:SCP domain-containing protein n=1 Tax=Haemonchus placei TaxID=6290 RepID=A0A0N4W2K8_HAEPC|nr:unnamed protein product [Haemonchus placei]
MHGVALWAAQMGTIHVSARVNQAGGPKDSCNKKFAEGPCEAS